MEIGTWGIDDMRGKKYDPVDLALAPSPMCFKMLASHKLLHKKKNPSVFTKKFRQQIRATSLHTQESVSQSERETRKRLLCTFKTRQQTIKNVKMSPPVVKRQKTSFIKK